MTEDIVLKISEDDDCEYTHISLENGVMLTIFQHRDSDNCTIHIHNATRHTNMNIMGRKVTKKLNTLGNTRIQVVE